MARGDAQPAPRVLDSLFDQEAFGIGDDIGLLDPRIADATRIHGPRQVTDLYLLALAVSREGRFATFDASVPVNAIKGAERRYLVTL